ncbi:hypothetical protein ACWELJ_21390 [Nocardia sp. NPDC004582]
MNTTSNGELVPTGPPPMTEPDVLWMCKLALIGGVVLGIALAVAAVFFLIRGRRSAAPATSAFATTREGVGLLLSGVASAATGAVLWMVLPL